MAKEFLPGKMKDVVYIPIPYICTSLSRGHQTVTIMSCYCYFLMGSGN